MASALTSALLTDLYELSMLQAYFDEGMNGSASFELFSRRLPAGRKLRITAPLRDLAETLDLRSG